MVDPREKQEALIALPQIFPKLSHTRFTLDDITSEKTEGYNCIAYAAKDESRPWWPAPRWLSLRYYYWPDCLPREHPATVENFFKAFEMLGYEWCQNGKRELGFEKVAIYVDPYGVPTHMAREPGDGVWYSKLGDLQDIRHHVLEALENQAYGKAAYFMRKPLEGYPRWKRSLGKLLNILSDLRPEQKLDFSLQHRSAQKDRSREA
jgi:hypothetical protein